MGITISKEENSIGAGTEMTDVILPAAVRGEEDHHLAHQDREVMKRYAIERAIASAAVAVHHRTHDARITGQKRQTGRSKRLRNRLPNQHLLRSWRPRVN